MFPNNPKDRVQPYRQHWVSKDEGFETRYQVISIHLLLQANRASQAARCHYSALHGVKKHDRRHRFGTMYIVSVQAGSWDTDERNIPCYQQFVGICATSRSRSSNSNYLDELVLLDVAMNGEYGSRAIKLLHDYCTYEFTYYQNINKHHSLELRQ